MIEVTLSHRYAKALLCFAQEKGMVERLAGELAAFANLLNQYGQLKRNFAHPAIDLERKLALMDRISEKLGFSQEMKRFLSVLLKRRRLNIILDILNSYKYEVRSINEELKVSVETPFALTSQEKISLRDRLREIFKKKIYLEVTINKSLLGGIKVKVGNLIYDGSLKGRLHSIREALRA